MGRRTTLGAISPGSMNARRSSLGISSRVAQGTGGAAGKQSNAGSSRRQSLRPPSTTGRQSTGGTRRSSLYNKTVSGPKSDPRPVTDKSYQQACVRSIISYLSSHGYDNAISPKQLSTPTTKDFLAIVTFLFKQIEPGFKVLGKLEEEVPGMFKRLRYPFPISKTALVAVGSPHTWPPLLAALAWLVELLNYSERALSSADLPQTPEALADRDTSGDREFFEYVSKSYRYFLSGDDEMCAAVDEETEARFIQKDEQTREDIGRLEKANEALQAQLDDMTGQPSPKALLVQKREDIIGDIEKLRSLLSSLQQHRRTLQKKIAEREADLTAKREEMALLEKESEGIRHKISIQPINKEDIARMNYDRAKLQMALDATTQHREQLDSEVAKSELALEEQMEALETASWDYNKSADQLQLIPSTAKRAAGVEFEMAVNRNATNGHETLSVDLKGVVRPALTRIHEQYVAKRRAASEALLMAREQLGIQEEGLIERREENLVAEAQVHQMEEKHKAARESLEKAISSANSEVEKIQSEITNLQSSASDSVIESEERLARGKEELENTKRSCHEELQALNDDLTTALNLLVNHKLHTQDLLEELQSKSQATLAAINAQAVPI